MKKILLIVILLSSLGFQLYAQSGTIKGVVKDAGNQENLFGVNVIVRGTTTGTSTGIDGDFTLNVKSGNITLVFSYLGYDTKEQTVTVSDGQTKTISIELNEEATLLNTVVVSASKFEKKLGEETVSLDVIKPSFLENQNLVTIDNAVERSPGVAVIDGQVNIRGGSGYSYGAGSRVLLLLDDLPILQADAGFPNWSSIPTENIGQIEIIKGAASALYGSSAMNGVINVRTAYATNEPITKISIYGTQYATPKDEDGNKLDWWNMDPKTFFDNTTNYESGDVIKSTALVNVTYPDASDSTRGNYDFVNPKRLTRPYETGLSFGHRQKFGKFDLVLGGQVVSSQDHKYNGFDNRGRVSVQTRYRINEKVNFGINANVQAGRSGTFFLWNGIEGVNKYITADLTGDPTITKGKRITIDPFFNFQDDKGNKHKILARWYKVDNDNGNNQGNFSNFFYGEYQYQKRWDKANMTLTTGAVASYVSVEAPLYGTVGSDKLSGRNYALFLQLDKKFFDKLNVSVGGRLEHYQITSTKAETKPVFRAGVNYQAAEYTYIRASFGQGFRFPTIAEKFISTSLGTAAAIVPNNDLKSETGMSAELGFKQGIKIGKFNAFIDIAGFFTRYNNMMEFNPNSDVLPIIVKGDTMPYVVAFQSQNVGNTQIIGVETSIQGEGKIANKFPTTLMLGYTYLMPTYLDWEETASNTSTSAYNVLKYRFRHMFTSSWDINLRGFDLGVSARYFSFMENIDNSFEIIIPELQKYRESKQKDSFDPEKGGYKGDFVLDLRAGYTFKKNKNSYKISAIVNNVMNREYSLRPGLVEAPLTYALRVDFQF
jgi:iron complex outermembrane receptor protein